MNQRRIVDLALSDFVRMFDTICHSAILAKLHCFSVNDVLLKWIERFLANKCMQIKQIDGECLHKLGPATARAAGAPPTCPWIFLHVWMTIMTKM